MKDSTEEKINDIFTKISDALDVPIGFAEDKDDQNKVIPVFDVNGFFSKLVALCVYSGFGVPSTFAPAYNRVHADIEFFKKKFESDSDKEALLKVIPCGESEPSKETADGVSQSQ